MTTVKLETVSSNIIKMIWEKRINGRDATQSLQDVTDFIEASAQPVFVLVDITAKPDFPMMTIVTAALAGPFRHPNLREWLIIGSGRVPQMIEQTLSTMSKRRNVRWFDTEADALAYARNHSAAETGNA